MKVLVVEGEKYTSRKLEQMLKSFDSSIDIVTTVPSILSSVKWIKKNSSPDLILVSKNILNKQTRVHKSSLGIEATVTFSTPSDNYSFRAFRRWSKEQENKSQEGQAQGTSPYRKRFLVKHGQRLAAVPTEEIAYFFSFKRFIYFKTFDGQKYLVEYSLEELEDMLDPQLFFRVNRSLLLAFKGVSQIHPYSGNRLKLHLYPLFEKEVLVSREKVYEFKTWLGQ